MQINSANLESAFLEFNMSFWKAFETTDVWWPRLAMLTSSSTERNVYPISGQQSRMVEWIGTRAIQNLEAFDHALVNKKFQTAVGIDRVRFEDDQLGMFGNIMGDMGEQVAKQPDDEVRRALQSNDLCYDGLTFFNDAHPERFGDPNSNTFDNDRSTFALTAANWEIVSNEMSARNGFNGELIGARPDTLVVPPQLRTLARDVLNAELVNGGDTNTLRGDADILVIDDLANAPTIWYPAKMKGRTKPLIFQEREAPQFTARQNPEDPIVWESDKFLFGATRRNVGGVGLPQLITRCNTA